MENINLNGDIFMQLDSLLSEDDFEMSILANTSAFLNELLENINWVGFYILKNDYLYLGPFQGKIACIKIKVGNGVCGTSAKLKETIVVPDVHLFPGHIACDAASNSEIVIPIFIKNNLYGVLDIDSPIKNRFSDNDRIILEKLVKVLEKHLKKISN
jgi:GAF domain-containing protein